MGKQCLQPSHYYPSIFVTCGNKLHLSLSLGRHTALGYETSYKTFLKSRDVSPGVPTKLSLRFFPSLSILSLLDSFSTPKISILHFLYQIVGQH